MKVSIIPLNTFASDSATGLPGLLTHLYLRSDGHQTYGFQPRGLNPEDKQPVKSLWVTADRLSSHAPREDVDLPLQVLGTHVTEIASGFNGTATVLVLHTTGCLHVEVQPKGVVEKTGAAIESNNFDIRRLEGPALKKLTPEELKKDINSRPSPTSYENPRY